MWRGAYLVTKRQNSSAVSPLVKRVLIANRGEIACRVIQTCKRLNIEAIAVYSDEDRFAKHVRWADRAFHIGPAAALQSYLVGEKVLEVAQKAGADAIHPGYGFLSENADFAQLCESNGVRFVGPPASAITAMGSKSESKLLMERANVPVVRGYHGEDQSDAFLRKEADRIGYPVIIKPVMGGGGKGMRIVYEPEKFQAALESSRSEALHAFKDDRVLVERYLQRPRHIEMQVFCDTHGNAVHLFERDCSVQRRHQKIYEESPAPLLSPELRADFGAKAVAAARAVGYVGAGTVEFILDAETNEFFFMEMNTRLQVEHPVTEAVTGVDLVEWQLRVASGQPLPCNQQDLRMDGHAIEARIYAEDPRNSFRPTAGPINFLRIPKPDTVFGRLGSRGVRIDSGVEEGDRVSNFYDPMIAKLIVKAPTRAQALKDMERALSQYQVVGVATNIEFLRRVAGHDAFKEGGVTTGFIAQHQSQVMPTNAPQPDDDGVLLAALASLGSVPSNTTASSATGPLRVNLALSQTLQFTDGESSPTDFSLTIPCTFLPHRQLLIGNTQVTTYSVTPETSAKPHVIVRNVDAHAGGRRIRGTVVTDTSDGKVHVFITNPADGQPSHLKLRIPPPAFVGRLDEAVEGGLVAPMPGEVRKVFVKAGDRVKRGDRLVVLVAMKMENEIVAPYDGVVAEVIFREKDSVPAGAALVVLSKAPATN